MVIFNFIRDKEVGIFARVKRKGKETSASTAYAAVYTAKSSIGSDSEGSDSDGKKCN